MQELVTENLRIDPDVGDGILFTVNVRGIARRYFVSRETLSDISQCRLADNHALFASFERHEEPIRQAIRNTLKFGASSNITFLHRPFFN